MMLLISFIAVIFFAIWETYYDGKLLKQLKIDGKFESNEDNLVHLQQLPSRAIVILLAGFAAGTQYSDFWVLSVTAMIAYAFIYWLLFDVLINVFVLHEKASYIGKTSKIDRYMGSFFFSGWIYIGFKAAMAIFFSIILIGSL